MSARDRATGAAIAGIATACDGAILGLALAFWAAQTWAKYRFSSSALDKIRHAPAARISDLRSIISSDVDSSPSSSSSSCGGKLVVVRGEVQTKSAVGATNHTALVSQVSGKRAVVVQRTQTCLEGEWRGIGWGWDLHALFAKLCKEQHSSSLRTVPFILVEAGQWPHSGFVNVKLDGSTHPLPLTTVYHQLLPVQASPYSFFHVLLGYGYPVALLDEEKILPVGEDITAVGLCSLQDGVLEIKPSEELPCFLSDLTKDEMEAGLAISANILFWGGILLGALSVGILGYATVRNWWRWKDWRHRRRRLNGETRAASAAATSVDDESGDVPDGELCVICLMRRRRSAFVPCGHLVCCPRCASAVGLDSSPKCPVCRQSIRSSVRIYNS